MRLMKSEITLTIFRMPDSMATGGTLRVSHVLCIGTTPLLRAYEDRPWTPWSPEVEWPEDMWSLALSLEKALDVRCNYRDVRGEVALPPVRASTIRLNGTGIRLVT